MTLPRSQEEPKYPMEGTIEASWETYNLDRAFHSN